MHLSQLVPSHPISVLLLTVIVVGLQSAPCHAEPTDNWVGSWAIHHQVLGVPRLVRLEVRRTGDHLDAKLTSETGAVEGATIAANAEKLDVTYKMDIAESVGHAKLTLERDHTDDSIRGSLSVKLNQSASRFTIKATAIDSGKAFVDLQHALQKSRHADRNDSGTTAKTGRTLQGRWQLKLKSDSNEQKDVTMGMLVASRNGGLVVGLSGLNHRGPPKVIESFTALDNGLRWTYPAGIFGDLNMDIHDEGDSISVVIANPIGGVFLSGTGIRVADNIDIGVDRDQVLGPIPMTSLGSVDEYHLIAIKDSYALLQANQTVRAVATDDPFLAWVDFLELPEGCRLIDLAADTAWGRSGTKIEKFVITPEGTVKLVSSCTIPGNSPSLVTTFGELAFAANWNGQVDSQQVHVIGLKSSEPPQLLSSITTPKGASNYDACVIGNRLFLANAWGLRVVDIQDPEHPKLLFEFEGRGKYVRGVDGADSTLFIATSWHQDASWIQGIDITDPSSPKQSSLFETSGGAQDVAIDETLVYVADHRNGVLAVDVSDLATPRLIGKFTHSKTFKEIAVSGNVVLASTSGPTQIFLKKLDMPR